MKKNLCMLLLGALLLLSACGTTASQDSLSTTSDVSETSAEMTEYIILHVNEQDFTVILEDNEAAQVLVEMLPFTLEMSDYGGFEKVGALGENLPTSNSQMTTTNGDIVLYNGNQLVVFYGSNTWSYTKLGHLEDVTGWEEALGEGDVTLTLDQLE